MKSLLQHINESDLSIESFLKDNNIDVDDAIKILTKYAKKENIKLEELEDFFSLHGISQLNWGRRNTAAKQFINLFNEDDNLDVLLEVVKNDGIISVDDLNESGNIFDLLCSSILISCDLAKSFGIKFFSCVKSILRCSQDCK